jgi:hypothetical protein
MHACMYVSKILVLYIIIYNGSTYIYINNIFFVLCFACVAVFVCFVVDVCAAVFVREKRELLVYIFHK